MLKLDIPCFQRHVKKYAVVPNTKPISVFISLQFFHITGWEFFNRFFDILLKWVANFAYGFYRPLGICGLHFSPSLLHNVRTYTPAELVQCALRVYSNS